MSTCSLFSAHHERARDAIPSGFQIAAFSEQLQFSVPGPVFVLSMAAASASEIWMSTSPLPWLRSIRMRLSPFTPFSPM